jgi:hypothetical protein
MVGTIGKVTITKIEIEFTGRTTLQAGYDQPQAVAG